MSFIKLSISSVDINGDVANNCTKISHLIFLMKSIANSSLVAALDAKYSFLL